MQRELIIEEELKQYLVRSEDVHDGTHYSFEFPNKYGASVVSHKFIRGGNEGLWELAVTKYNEEDGFFHLYYSTYLTNDVISAIDEDQVMMYLKKIKKMTEKKSYWGLEDCFDIIDSREGINIDTVLVVDKKDLAALLSGKKLYYDDKNIMVVLDA